MLRVPGVLLTLIVSVFISYSLHVEFKLEVCSWRRSSDSFARLWSSAKSNSLRDSGSVLDSFVILSTYKKRHHSNIKTCLRILPKLCTWDVEVAISPIHSVSHLSFPVSQ